jgi:hypothetical protein
MIGTSIFNFFSYSNRTKKSFNFEFRADSTVKWIRQLSVRICEGSGSIRMQCIGWTCMQSLLFDLFISFTVSNSAR